MAGWFRVVVSGVLLVVSAAPAFSRDAPALVAASPSALGPWATCDVVFSRPDTGYSSPVFRRVPVALREAQKHTGLKVAASGGRHLMLFSWPEAQFVPFWMKGVTRALSVAFIGPDGRVVGIDRMQPETTRFYFSDVPIVAALEAETPLFDKAGVKLGAVMQVRHCDVSALQRFSDKPDDAGRELP